jgi:hypothetical protein
MKILWYILILLLPTLSSAQESCLPHYGKEVKKVRLRQGTIAYVEEGQGQPIIFIHGLGGNLG